MPSRGWCLYSKCDMCLLNGTNLSPLGLADQAGEQVPLSESCHNSSRLNHRTQDGRNPVASLVGKQEEEH